MPRKLAKPPLITEVELESIGLGTRAKVVAVGWEEAFLRWVEAYPERLNLNAAVGLIAKESGVHWLQVPPSDKERARALIDSLRRERGQKPTARPRRKHPLR
jgi:hypothetical protein